MSSVADPGEVREWFTQRAAEWGSAPALVRAADGQRLCYGELPEVLQRRAQGMGLSRSAVGAIYGRRVVDPWHCLLDLLAAAWAGATVLPLSGRWPRTRLQHALRQWNLPDTSAWRSEAFCWTPSDPALAPPPGSLLATSGSSGEPKLVHHLWRAHWANAAGAAAVIPLGLGDAWWVDLPLWHASGWAAVLRCWQGGATAVLASSSDMVCPSKWNCTHRSMVTTQLQRALAGPATSLAVLRSLKALLVGGGPVPGPLRARALAQDLPLHVTYGMTETASQICTTGRLYSAWPEVSGSPLPGREVRAGAGGELLVRGPVLATGYWKGSAGLVTPWGETGWFATGDVGEWVDGALPGWRILGRRDRCFICAGENLHPEKIEAVLLSLPGVQAAVVVPQDDPEYGQRPVAFIAGQGTVQVWQALAREELTGLEMPTAWLRWPPEVSPSEKPPLAWLQRYLTEATARGVSLPEHRDKKPPQ